MEYSHSLTSFLTHRFALCHHLNYHLKSDHSPAEENGDVDMEDGHGLGYNNACQASNGIRHDHQERDDHRSKNADASSSQSPSRGTRSTRATRGTRNEGTAIAAVAAAAAEAEAAAAAAQSTVSINRLRSSTRFNTLLSLQIIPRPTADKANGRMPVMALSQHIVRLPHLQTHLVWQPQPKGMPRRSCLQSLPLLRKAITYTRRRWRAF